MKTLIRKLDLYQLMKACQTGLLVFVLRAFSWLGSKLIHKVQNRTKTSLCAPLNKT